MVKKIIKIAYIVLALAFIYAPIILLTIYSFNLSPSIGIWSKEWGFGLYKQLFTDDSIMQTVLNTCSARFRLFHDSGNDRRDRYVLFQKKS